MIIPESTITTNKQFLQQIFGEYWQWAQVCNFAQEPAQGNWSSKFTWQAELDGTLERADLNQYFVVSLFGQDGQSQRARRTKALFVSQNDLMVDDVGIIGSVGGVKVDINVLEGKIQPQYLIETSPGNYQAHYVFGEPVKDAELMTRVIQAMIDQGLGVEQDTGFAGVTRYGRLPVGYNNKPEYGETPFQCKLIPVEPDNRPSVRDFVAGWNLVLGDVKSRSAPMPMSENDFTWQMMEKYQLWGPEQGGGFYQVECPQSDQHTIQDDRTGMNPETGEFKCFHGSCESLNRGDYESYLYKEYPAEGARHMFGEPAEPGTVQSSEGSADKVDRYLEKLSGLTSRDLEVQSQVLWEAKCSLDTMQWEVFRPQAARSIHLGVQSIDKIVKDIKKASLGLQSNTSLVQGAARDMPGDFARDYVFVLTGNKYFNVHNKKQFSASAIEGKFQLRADDFKQVATASALFHEGGGKTVNQVTWMPWAYGGKPTLILDHGYQDQSVNCYMPPKYLEPNGDDAAVAAWLWLLRYLVPKKVERDNLIDHMAFTLMHPEIKIGWQILWVGPVGVGKDLVLRPLVKHLGDAASEIGGAESKRDWGDGMAKKKVLVYSELDQGGDREFENHLKTLAAGTASDMTRLNLKGGGIIEQPNLFSIYSMSNYLAAMHLDADDRRWYVINSLGKRPVYWTEEDPENPARVKYYADMFAWMDHGGGIEAVCAWLMARDLSGFSVGTRPGSTSAHGDVAEAGMKKCTLKMKDLVDSGAGVFSKKVFRLRDIAGQLGFNGEHTSSQASLTKDLQQLGFVPVGKQGRRKHRVSEGGDGKKKLQVRLWRRQEDLYIEELNRGELYRLWEEGV